MRATLAVLLFVAGAAAIANAATTAKDPQALALQPSDFPAGAVSTTAYPYQPLPGGRVLAYTATYVFKSAGQPEMVTVDVQVAKSLADARSQYKLRLASETKLPDEKALTLPAYGSEQSAAFRHRKVFGATENTGVVVVRKNTVVWMLSIENCGPNSNCGNPVSNTIPPISQAQAVRELKIYAAKAKARIGSG